MLDAYQRFLDYDDLDGLRDDALVPLQIALKRALSALIQSKTITRSGKENADR